LSTARYAEFDCSALIDMLYTAVVGLLVFWMLAFVSAYTLGGYIHILLFLAGALLLVGLMQGRRLL